MRKKYFFMLVVFSCFYLYSCKSISSQTSGRFNFENKTIEKDHFQYVDVYNVYTGERYDRNVNPVAQHYVLAKKIDDRTYIITFSNQINYIPDNMAYLIDFKPKNVFFTALAKLTSKGTYTIYTTSPNQSENEDGFLIFDSTTGSSHTQEDYNNPIGVAVHTQKNCDRALDGSSSPTNICFIVQELCTGSYANKCELGWQQPNQRYGIPYYISRITLR